jgi:hypothetical protein
MPLPRIPGSERPPPPAELSAREAEIWRDIVDSRPLHYFGRETWLMLAALCTHAAQAELLAAELRRHPSQKNRDEHRKQTMAVATLSTRTANWTASPRANFAAMPTISLILSSTETVLGR